MWVEAARLTSSVAPRMPAVTIPSPKVPVVACAPKSRRMRTANVEERLEGFPERGRAKGEAGYCAKGRPSETLSKVRA